MQYQGNGATRTWLTRSLAALATVSLLGVLVPATAQAEGAQFPEFTYQGPVFDRSELSYNPTNEWDFPHVWHAGDHLDDPLGDYYLYTAPHGSPGGIALFYADSPAGPWTEYASNPVIARDWEGQFSVSHVSSPHAIWLEDEAQLLLYFHGENSQTRFASSPDGIDFSYEGIAVDAAMSGPDVSEASYARVYEHQIDGRGNRYFMVFMDAVPGDGIHNRSRRIRLAVSQDARNWTVDQQPLISPFPEVGSSISGPQYLTWRDDGHYVAYHGSNGDIYVTEVGPRFDQSNHLGILYRSTEGAPDNGRAASPTFIVEGSTLHLFYESGGRNKSTIAHAVASLSASGVPLAFDPPPPEPEPEPEPEPDGPLFSDVSTRSSHYPAIQVLGQTGMTKGCNAAGTLYCPTEAVSRAEMATFLMRGGGLRTDLTSTRFTDVSSSSSHVPGIAAIDRAKLTNGCGGTRYCPSRGVTRAEMATFLMRATGLEPASGMRYADVSPTSSHAPAIEAIAEAGLTNGCGGNNYCPDRQVTRAEMATFLVRAFELGS